MRKAIDQFVAARVTQFATNQPLQISIVGLQPLGLLGESAIIGHQPVARRFQPRPVIA